MAASFGQGWCGSDGSRNCSRMLPGRDFRRSRNHKKLAAMSRSYGDPACGNSSIASP